MRGDYEAKNDRHPFQVQFIGLNEVGVRNLATDQIHHRERKISTSASEAGAKEQWDRLDNLAFTLAKERREATLKPADDHTSHETLAQSAARILGYGAHKVQPTLQ